MTLLPLLPDLLGNFQGVFVLLQRSDLVFDSVRAPQDIFMLLQESDLVPDSVIASQEVLVLLQVSDLVPDSVRLLRMSLCCCRGPEGAAE